MIVARYDTEVAGIKITGTKKATQFQVDALAYAAQNTKVR